MCPVSAAKTPAEILRAVIDGEKVSSLEKEVDLLRDPSGSDIVDDDAVNVRRLDPDIELASVFVQGDAVRRQRFEVGDVAERVGVPAHQTVTAVLQGGERLGVHLPPPKPTLPGFPKVARSTPPGRPPPTLRITS